VINQLLPAEEQIMDPEKVLDLMDFNKNDGVEINEFFEVRGRRGGRDEMVVGVSTISYYRGFSRSSSCSRRYLVVLFPS